MKTSFFLFVFSLFYLFRWFPLSNSNAVLKHGEAKHWTFGSIKKAFFLSHTIVCLQSARFHFSKAPGRQQRRLNFFHSIKTTEFHINVQKNCNEKFSEGKQQKKMIRIDSGEFHHRAFSHFFDHMQINSSVNECTQKRKMHISCFLFHLKHVSSIRKISLCHEMNKRNPRNWMQFSFSTLFSHIFNEMQVFLCCVRLVCKLKRWSIELERKLSAIVELGK